MSLNTHSSAAPNRRQFLAASAAGVLAAGTNSGLPCAAKPTVLVFGDTHAAIALESEINNLGFLTFIQRYYPESADLEHWQLETIGDTLDGLGLLRLDSQADDSDAL